MAKKTIEESVLIKQRYVIGVTWRAIINRGAMGVLAKKRAKEEVGTNYYAHYGEQKYVGAALIKDAPNDGEMYSLAKIFMKRLPSFGYHLVCIQVSLDAWWVCVIESGTPRFDKVLHKESEVRHIVSKYEEDSGEGGLQTYGDGSIELADIQSLSFEDLASGRDDEALFTPLGQKTDPRIYVFAGVALLLGGAFFGWTYYNRIKAEQEAARRAAEEAAAALTPVQMDAAWEKQFIKVLSEKRVVDHAGLTDLRNVLLQLPLTVGGWRTGNFTCTLINPNWKCLAVFARSKDLAEGATNKTLVDNKPPGWDVAFKSLGEAQVTFLFPAVIRGMTKTDLVPAAAFQIDSISAVQTYANYFSTLTVGELAKEKLPPPIAPNGAPVDPVKTQPTELQRVEVVVNAPLRNTYLFDEKAPKVFWQTVELKASPTLSGTADFRSSIVNVTIKGEMYATDR